MGGSYNNKGTSGGEICGEISNRDLLMLMRGDVIQPEPAMIVSEPMGDAGKSQQCRSLAASDGPDDEKWLRA